ncbi:MAG: flavoprotein [Roseibacillus sp.]|nr:flavoprotein [Roseibacillus sp.]
MKTLIVSCSLHAASKSRQLAGELESFWRSNDAIEVATLDLRSLGLPPCDGGPSYAHPATEQLQSAFTEADAVVFAVPIYNYDINSAAKNAIELAGRQLTDKVAGFLCAAGGHRSYMSVMAAANSLMLDFRTIIIPRFVYAGGDDIPDGGELNDEIRKRVAQFGEEFLRLARAIHAA